MPLKRTRSSNLPGLLSALPILAMFVASSQPGWTRTYDSQVNSLLAEATAALKGGQADSAERMFRQAIVLERNCPDAWTGIGLVEARRGHDRQALEAFQTALNLEPNHYDALYNAAMRYYSQKLYKQSLSYLLRAKEVMPVGAGPDLLVNVANCYRDKSIEEGDAEKESDLKKALSFYQQAISANPQLPTAHANLGEFYYQTGDLSKAESELRLATELNPNYAFAYFWLAQVLVGQNRFAEALVAYDNSLQAETNTGYREDTLKWLKALVVGPKNSKNFPADVCDHFARGFRLVADKKYDQAEVEFEFVTDHAQAAAIKHFAWNNIGYVRGLQGKREAAIQAYNQALAAKPKGFAAPFYNMGQLYLQQDNVDEAARLFTAATEAEPGQFLAHNALGLCLARKKRPDKALVQYNLAIAQFGNRVPPVVHFNKAMALEQLGRNAEARKFFQEYLDRSPNGINAAAAGNHLAKLK